MKVASLVLLLVHLHDALGDAPLIPRGKISHEKSPKKNLQLLLARRFFKQPETKTKKANPANSGYTVFPVVGDTDINVNIPESLYFPEDAPKSRVKKVLPAFALSRKKRSADLQKQVPKAKEHTQVSTVEGQNASQKNGSSLRSRHRKRKHKRHSKHDAKPVRQKHRKKLKGNKTKHGKRPRRLKYTKKSKGKRAKGTKKSKKSKRTRKPKAKASRRLIAGKDAMIEDYPYMVSIQKDREHWCSGALLNPRLVITTANCVWKSKRVSRLSIRAGSRSTGHGGQTANVQELMKHPAWSVRKNPDNDLALMLLDRKIKFSDSVHGVDLPNRAMLPAFDDAWVTSWGAERRDGVYDKPEMTLQSYHARMIDRAKCSNVTQRFGVVVTDNFICLSQVGKRAPCTRDTGAPAVSDGVVWGLASWGIRKLCGTQRFPAMFSYTGSLSNMDFIVNATHHLMSEERHYPYLDRFPDVPDEIWH